MSKKRTKLFPKCADRRHDCHWFMEDDGTCALLNAINKHCTFHKTNLEVALSKERHEQLLAERRKTR